MADYLLTVGCKGYNSLQDPTNTDEHFLVSGSQNMIINDQERIESRAGYELFGDESDTAFPPKSEFSWENSTEGEIMVRETNGVLEFYSEVSEEFETLLTGLSTTRPVRFAPCWNGTELIDVLLFVNHSAVLYEWSGGQATYVSSDSSHIVVNETIATSRFFNGTGSIRVKDNGGTWRVFTVTATSGSTFTVSEDPTAFTFTANALVIQAVRTTSNKPASGYVADTIKVFQSQVFIGSHTSQRVYVSKNTDYTDFSFSSPRVAGEGALITLDGAMVGMEVPGTKETDSESKIIAFCKGDRGYEITFEVSPGSAADREVPRVKPLPLSGGQGAQSQELICKVKKTIVWISNDNELLDLGQVQSESFDDSTVSNEVQPDFDVADFTNGAVKYKAGSIHITAPPDGKMFIYDTNAKFWQPPQVLGMRLMSIYHNLLYGHSNSVSETYELFAGLSDNGNPIAFKAYFAYRNANKRATLKNFNKFFTELYIQANTTVTCNLLFEWRGAKQRVTYDLKGNDSQFLFTPTSDPSLGVQPLGTNPLGGRLEAGEDTPKYRRFKPIVSVDHFEYQVRLEADGEDQAFQILATGSNTKYSLNLPVKITK